MDTTEVRAAGMRVQKQTFDQAIDKRIDNRTFQSQIFGGAPTTAPPTRQSLAKQSDIFGVQAAGQKSEIRTAPRQSGTYQSSIFTFDETPQQRPPTAVSKLSQSQLFNNEPQAPVKKQYQSKNNEHRMQDHGKDFLFGKTDYTDYKTLKRAATSSQFEPKLDYNPEDRHIRELYGNEISKDGLLPHKNVNLKKQTSTQVPKKKEYDPSTRKEELLQSNIFHSDEKRDSTKIKPEPLTSSTAKWNTEFAKQKNNPKEEIDPDTYARDKKEKELQSSVFGQKQAPAKKNKEEKKEENQPEKKTFVKKEKLMPSNLDWKKIDTVKNLKDFAPNQDQQTNDGESLKVTASQKKFQGLQSTLDTHTFQAQQEVNNEEKISKKNLKYKNNILTREEKPKTTSKQISKNESVKQLANQESGN